MTDDTGFVTTLEADVRFAETDAQGIVFFGNYITYLDEAVLNFWREIGYPYESVLGGDWEVVIAHVDVDYHDSARYGDRLRHAVRVDAVGTASITFAYRGERIGDDTLCASGHLTQVVIDGSGSPVAVPDEIREAIEAAEAVPPETSD